MRRELPRNRGRRGGATHSTVSSFTALEWGAGVEEDVTRLRPAEDEDPAFSRGPL